MHACMQPADRSNPTALDTNTNPVCHVDPPVVPWPVALLLLVCSSFACIRGRRQPAPAVSRAPPRRATQRSHGENSRKPRQRLARVPARPLAPVRRQGAGQATTGHELLPLPAARVSLGRCVLHAPPSAASEWGRAPHTVSHPLEYSTVQCAGPLHPKSCQYVASSEL